MDNSTKISLISLVVSIIVSFLAAYWQIIAARKLIANPESAKQDYEFSFHNKMLNYVKKHYKKWIIYMIFVYGLFREIYQNQEFNKLSVLIISLNCALLVSFFTANILMDRFSKFIVIIQEMNSSSIKLLNQHANAILIAEEKLKKIDKKGKD